MSTTLPAPQAAATGAAAPTLDGLRAELDRIDDALHDLLMRRAETVEQVGARGAKGPVSLRPGREAAILRRLLRRNRGTLPPATVARVWREVVSAGAAIQGPFSIAVCEASDPAGEFAAAAREHFGALVRLRVHRTPAGAIREVSAGSATAAVLPLPREDEPPAAAWWTALLHRRTDDPRISIVGRLPFWAARPEGSPRVHALVASAAAPDASGEDHSLLGLELPPELSRARLGTGLAAAGLPALQIILLRSPAAASAPALALVEVDGFVRDDDRRLHAVAGVLRPPVVLGAYAVPFSPELNEAGGGR